MAEITDAGSLDDIFGDNGPADPTPPSEPSSGDNGAGGNSEGTSSDDDTISEFLSTLGISDPSKIKFEEDDGSTIERNWKDLTKDEKLSILSTAAPPDDISEYSQEELDLIQKIRDTQQTPAEYLESLKREAANSVVQTPLYEIDKISDDELFVLDAIDKYGEENVSDEQLEELLKNAKSDSDLYAKTIESLRAQYKQREDELKYQEQQESEAQREQEFQEFSASVLNEIKSLDQVGGMDIELSVDDMNDLANYILTRDDDGNSEFGKIMNDPKQFVALAFWARKGNDIMSEISSQLKAAYEKGIQVGKKGQSPLAFNNNPKDNHKSALNSFESAAMLDVD